MNVKIIISWAIRFVVLFVAVIGLYAAHQYIQSLRIDRATALHELEKTPDRLLDAAAQRADLSKYTFDITRIRSYLITRADVVTVVSRIEQEGQSENLQIQVPTIDEVIVSADDAAVAAPANDSLTTIAINVSVEGDPGSIVRFAHKVEHLPYLVSLQFMAMGSKTAVASQGSSVAAPPEEGETVALPTAHAEFTFLLSVKKEI